MQVGTCHSPASKYLKAEKGPTRLHSLKCKLSIKVCEALLSPPASPLWALYPVIPPPHLIYVSLLCAPVIPRISLRALIILYVITYLIIHFLHLQTLTSLGNSSFSKSMYFEISIILFIMFQIFLPFSSYLKLNSIVTSSVKLYSLFPQN